MKREGFFIVFEGTDGSGKTTQVDLLANFLAAKDFRVLTTREPGGTDLGESLRDILLNFSGQIDPLAEMLVFAAARAQHVREKILPALQGGMVVISDRFTDSMYAYQGYGKGVSEGFLEQIDRNTCQGLIPDLTILLDIDPSGAMSRINRTVDRIEKEGQNFLQIVREGYLSRAKKDPGRYLVVNASMPALKVFEQVTEALEKNLRGKNN